MITDNFMTIDKPKTRHINNSLKCASLPSKRKYKCFACSREFIDTDKLIQHEENEHRMEYHTAMVREMYGYTDGYDFEANAQAQP